LIWITVSPSEFGGGEYDSTSSGKTRLIGTLSPSFRLSLSIFDLRRVASDSMVNGGAEATGGEGGRLEREQFRVKAGGGDAGDAGIVSRVGFTEATFDGGG
jgi:hypothetical protein